ncbi:TBC1 domain family member 12 isoform X3 [Hypomesus transpacificus]|uniref:TBC1 domain family member 12 isoform X3 n=1 Tax=Hypomesus transpacificus TaxID=137520 RepID=UPI001F07492B|nr:TBC1 domain family member 12 isoform X3 [Hypomesus transpacificus]
METSGDRSLQPALSVNLNDRATITSLGQLSGDTTEFAACLSNVNKDETGRSGRRDSLEVGEGDGDIARSSTEFCALRQCTRIDGSGNMLDLVTESPSGCAAKDNDISKSCNVSGSSSNGFTKSKWAERGGTNGNESCPAPGTMEIDEEGKALKALSLCDQIKDASADPCGLNAVTTSHTEDSLIKSYKGQTADRSSPEGILNGEAVCYPQSTPVLDADRQSRSEQYKTADPERKMSNGGLMLGSCRDVTFHQESVSPPQSCEGETCVSLTHLEKPFSCTANSSLCQSSGQTEEPGRTEDESRTQENMVREPQPHGASSVISHGCSPNPAQTTNPDTAPATIEAKDNQASDQGLSNKPAPEQRPLASSMSYAGPSLNPKDDVEGRVVGEEGQCGPSFMDVSLSSRNTFESSRRQSAPGHLPPGLSVVDSSELALQSQRPGVAEYFGRSLFSRKQKEQSAPGWKLFGKVPLRESPSRDCRTIQQESVPGCLTSVSTPDLLNTGEYEAKVGRTGNSPTQNALGRRKNLEFEPLSTTALILEDRPANLPAKSVEEAQRHRQEYEEMVAEAKKRELKEAQKKQKMIKERLKQEEGIANAMLVWNNDILPHWDSMKNTRRARELWWQGLPPNVRGRVWSLAISNELNITPELYQIFLSRAKEKWRIFSETGSESEVDDGASLADRESSLDLIKLDISRTFPPLFIFQKGGPYHDVLHSVLGAYTCYRPDVGYVQGMSFIAAVLILNLDEADAFIAFANLLNKPCQLAFFRVDHELMLKYFAAFEVFFEENLPRLFQHFQSYNLTPDLYLIDWIFTLYSKSLPLDVACRVWDVFCRDGEEILFRTGLGILRLYEDLLLQMDFIHVAQFLTRLPDDMLSDRLFACIAATPMVSGNRKWTQVFNALIKETEKNASG